MSSCITSRTWNITFCTIRFISTIIIITIYTLTIRYSCSSINTFTSNTYRSTWTSCEFIWTNNTSRTRSIIIITRFTWTGWYIFSISIRTCLTISSWSYASRTFITTLRTLYNTNFKITCFTGTIR